MSFNIKERDVYENIGIDLTIDVYTRLGKKYGISVTDFKIPESEYSPYDIEVKIRDKPTFIENKTRSPDYHWNDRTFDSGYYLAAKKNDGRNSLYNIWFPQDEILLIVNSETLDELTPEDRFVKHTKKCDDESPSGYEYNYIVPRDKVWICDYSNGDVKHIK